MSWDTPMSYAALLQFLHDLTAQYGTDFPLTALCQGKRYKVRLVCE